MKILFFGTPYFAEVVLKGMLDNGFDVVGVYDATEEDKWDLICELTKCQVVF